MTQDQRGGLCPGLRLGLVRAAWCLRRCQDCQRFTGYPPWPQPAPCAPAPTRPHSSHRSRSSRPRPWAGKSGLVPGRGRQLRRPPAAPRSHCSAFDGDVRAVLAWEGVGDSHRGQGAHSPGGDPQCFESHPPEFGLTGYLTWRTPDAGLCGLVKSLFHEGNKGIVASQGLGPQNSQPLNLTFQESRRSRWIHGSQEPPDQGAGPGDTMPFRAVGSQDHCHKPQSQNQSILGPGLGSQHL